VDDVELDLLQQPAGVEEHLLRLAGETDDHVGIEA